MGLKGGSLVAVSKHIKQQMPISSLGKHSKQKSTELWFLTKLLRPPPLPYANFGPESDFLHTLNILYNYKLHKGRLI